MAPKASGLLPTGTLDLISLVRALSSRGHADSVTKCTTCLYSTTSTHFSKQAHRTRPVARKDPYRIAQAAQRKTANLEKRRVLAEERKAAMGDPVRSKPTPFLQSLKLSGDPQSGESEYLNYELDPAAMEKQVEHSKWLTEPLEASARTFKFGEVDPDEHKQKVEKHSADHDNAVRAINLITSLRNASQKDKTRINVQRCIEEFGRHKTDLKLPPKPASLGPTRSTPSLDADVAPTPEETQRAELLAELHAIPKRAGPDTGSSEVQIAILTVKIENLAANLHNKDKVNKRNLRLLVHRRQKLLKYLRQQERAGPRWQNLVEKLAISDAMWKSEISL